MNFNSDFRKQKQRNLNIENKMKELKKARDSSKNIQMKKCEKIRQMERFTLFQNILENREVQIKKIKIDSNPEWTLIKKIKLGK